MQHATWLRPQTVPRGICTHLVLRCPSLDVLGGASRAMGAAVAPCAGRLVGVLAVPAWAISRPVCMKKGCYSRRQRPRSGLLCPVNRFRT